MSKLKIKAEKRQVSVHGTAVHVEYPDKLISHRRKGWGTQFEGEYLSQNWFHFSIPALTLTDNITPVLRKVCVFYDAMGFMLGGIQKVHIYDGPKKIFAFDDLLYVGDHSNKIDEFNCWDVSKSNKRIILGLGISVRVLFTPQGPEGGTSRITFTAASAEFSYEKNFIPRIIGPISLKDGNQ